MLIDIWSLSCSTLLSNVMCERQCQSVPWQACFVGVEAILMICQGFNYERKIKRNNYETINLHEWRRLCHKVSREESRQFSAIFDDTWTLMSLMSYPTHDTDTLFCIADHIKLFCTVSLTLDLSSQQTFLQFCLRSINSSSLHSELWSSWAQNSRNTRKAIDATDYFLVVFLLKTKQTLIDTATTVLCLSASLCYVSQELSCHDFA